MEIFADVSKVDVRRVQFFLLKDILRRNLLLENILAPVFLALLISPYVTLIEHGFWLLFSTAILFLRLVCVKFIEKNRDERPNVAYLFLNLSLFVNACLWPACWVIYFNPEFGIEIVFLLTFVILCVISGAGVSLLIQPESFYIFIISLLVPYIYLLSSAGNLIYLKISIVLILFAAGIAFLTARYRFSVKSQLEKELTNQQLMARYKEEKTSAISAEREKSRFLASASHDLRQPLHALNMFISLLQRQLNGDNSELIKSVNTSLSDLTILFNALLDTSRLDSGDVELNQEQVELSDLLVEAVTEYKLKAMEKSISLRCHIRPVEVITDRALLMQIICNLLDNAVKFTHSGGVFLSLRERKEGVLLQVWDTGIGIEKRFQKTVFKEFMQLNNSSRDRSRGVGLGLSNTKKICALLGCHFTMKSEIGRGTLVSVLIPEQVNYEIHTEDNLLHIHDDVQDLADIKILYIENEASALSMTKSVLVDMGATLLSAHNLDEAFLLTREKPDVIIADYHLGLSRTGVELAAELSRLPGQNASVIILTTEIGSEVRKICDEHCWPTLSKPVDPQMLKNMIIEVL